METGPGKFRFFGVNISKNTDLKIEQMLMTNWMAYFNTEFSEVDDSNSNVM